MRRVLLTVATITGAAIALAGVAHAAPSIEVRDAVARVTVIPENRPDVKVEIVRANPGLPLKVRQEGGKTVIDGDLKRRIHSCDSDNGQAQVRVGGLGEVSWQDMPQIVIRTPMSVDLGVGGAVFGSVGRANDLSFGSAGCGDWTLANVQGRARLSSAGSGDIRGGSAGEATVRLAGSGDLSLTDVRGALGVDVAGSGDVDVKSVAGKLDVKIAGSGDVGVRGGRATAVSAMVAGSGGLDFGGAAESLSAHIVGSGDVHVGHVDGSVSRTIMGSGRVRVGD
jgi:hypothetical protein